MADLREFAKAAAVEAHGDSAVGAFIDELAEADSGVVSYLFASKLKGYPDWRFCVTLFTEGEATTVSELNLIPGPESLLAPAWVPWSERLADYKALQAALEAEAAAAALEAEDSAEEDAEGAEVSLDEGADAQAQEQPVSESQETVNLDEAELAPADVPEGVDAQDYANDAGAKGKGLFKWKTLGRGKKRK
jgi:hypothetical protein